VANWKHLFFFDKSGKNYNMKYDSSTDKWTGDIFLPQVSIDLFEVGQLFILQKMKDANSGTFMFGYPHGYAQQSTGDNCDWTVEWETTQPDKIFLFQFNKDFNTGTQSALVQEPDGPPLIKVDKLLAPLQYDANQTVSPDGFIITDEIKSEALQIDIAFSSSEENTYKRKLIIIDECTNTTVAEFTVYAESIEEDERLRVMTQNMGYNVIASDSTVFRDTNLKEALPDYVEINLKRKEIMMEGHNVYPFIGSYKGLINAIKFFGYDNLKIKEFWKNVNANSPQFGKLIQSNSVDLFSPTAQFDDKKITLPNKNFRKTSMFSLIYRINRIVPGEFTDEDLPVTEELQDFTIEEILIKLFGLKRKLENEYLPLNAHIKGITAEADFFGLLEVTNTISRNDTNTIRAGINTDFKIAPAACTYLEDLRKFDSFCLEEAAVVSSAVIGFCNAYVAPLSGAGGAAAIGQNMIMDYTPGEILPPPPIGPDPNSVLGALEDGGNVSIKSAAGVYAAYFSRYAPNLNKVAGLNYKQGYSSEYLPDQPGTPTGALITLTNDSFNNLTWNNINSTWDQLTNANDFFTFDFNIQGCLDLGDVYTLSDPASGTTATHTVIAGDTVQSVTTSIFNQVAAFKTAQTDPWLWFDWSQVTNDIGPCIRGYGNDINRFVASVVLANPASGGVFSDIQLPGETLFTWDGLESGNFTEIEWSIYKDATDISPAYFFQIRGSIGKYGILPITLPYVGTYNVEMKLFDLYNNISSSVKQDAICVDAREVEYSGWYQSRKRRYTWGSEGKYTWKNYGSLWDLPIEPSVTWDEETPSLYESLDRVNAILNTFGIGTSTDFQLLNYQDNGKASFSGPYQWKNLNKKLCTWENGYHLWWEMTATTGDTPAFFQFSEMQPNTYLQITDINGAVGSHFFNAATYTLADAVAQLNVSTNSIINKYVYNLVLNSANNAMFVQAVSRYFGKHGDFKSVDIVDVNGLRICASGTGNATDYFGGEIAATTLYQPFAKALPINGMTLLSVGAISGAPAVTDNFVEKVARCIEMILDPTGSSIIYNKQAAVLQKMQSLKTIQRIGYIGMGEYTPGLETLPGWDQTSDNNANVDFVWETPSSSTNAQITEVLEHLLHTITTFGLPGAYPNVFNQTSPSGPTYAAMSEAINNGVFDTSGYSQEGKTLDEFRALLMREYLYLLIYAEWNFIATYISGGTLAPEWTATTPALVATDNPLGHALYTDYISKLLVTPSTTILNTIFATSATPSGYVPFEIDPSGGNVDCLSRIYKSSQSITSNPTWGTAKFINDGKTLPPMSWAMFVYDKCRVVGKEAPKWTISNTTNSSVADIYFESKYLTYLFKDPGKYMITLELTDTNGNKYKKGRNILNIKEIKTSQQI
jgi:hypothetical protein